MSYPFKMKSPFDSSDKEDFDPIVSFLFSSDKDKKNKKDKKKKRKKRNDIFNKSKEIR